MLSEVQASDREEGDDYESENDEDGEDCEGSFRKEAAFEIMEKETAKTSIHEQGLVRNKPLNLNDTKRRRLRGRSRTRYRWKSGSRTTPRKEYMCLDCNTHMDDTHILRRHMVL